MLLLARWSMRRQGPQFRFDRGQDELRFWRRSLVFAIPESWEACKEVVNTAGANQRAAPELNCFDLAGSNELVEACAADAIVEYGFRDRQIGGFIEVHGNSPSSFQWTTSDIAE